MASAESDRQEEEEEVAAAGDEEDTGAHVAPIVRLEEVAVTTGEEDEDALIDLKAKLYRFDKEGKQWKERGNGSVKLLKHKETGRVRLVMRQAKTLKICANHLVLPSTRMQEHAGNDKSCVWHAMDFSDGVLKEEMFAIRFGSVENCKKFMEMIEEIIADSFGKTEEKDSKDALSASHLIEKLSMTEPENQTHTKEPSVANNDKRVKEDEEKKQVESEQSPSTS
ncbi:ran-binding protein 1 homolog b-like [Curcuma longa]|uniref:ran-binding protein 1 homolog b-like n=1 Tax=Curcuma longa TaxID=136217 RepID=UPI003D9E719E